METKREKDITALRKCATFPGELSMWKAHAGTAGLTIDAMR